LIQFIIGHCLKNLPDVEYLCWSLDYYPFGTTCCKMAYVTSVYLKTSNGVRQGGILSPRLFSLYIDDLRTLLADTLILRVQITFVCRHVFIVPSATGLLKPIDAYQQYGVVHDRVYRPVKSMCMTMLPKVQTVNFLIKPE